MAVISTYADGSDGALVSSQWRDEGGTVNANPDFEDDARRGEDSTTDPGNAPETGQRIPLGGQKWNNGTQTNRYQAFVAFLRAAGFALPPGQVEVVNATIRVARNGFQYDAGSSDATFGALDSMQFWTRDWNPPLSTSAWMDMMPLQGSGTSGNFQPEAELSQYMADRVDFGNLYECGGEPFLTNMIAKLAASDDISYCITCWTEIQVYPKVASWLSWIVSANDTTVFTRRKPTLTFRTQRKHALNYVGGASVQMTDGTSVFLRYDSTNGRVSLYYQKVNQTTPTLIDYISTKVGTQDNSHGESQYMKPEAGFQSFGLTRDDSNNLYVAGPRGNQQLGTYGQKVFNVGAFRYNGNYSWSRFTQTTLGDNTFSDTDTNRGYVNQTVPVWLPTGKGPAGQLAVVHSRRAGQWSRYELGVGTLDAGWTTGSAPARSQSQNYVGDDANTSTWWRPWNGSGSNLDAFRIGNRIYMVSAIQSIPGDEVPRSAAITCDVSATNVVSKPTVLAATIQNFPVADPDGKMRAIWLGDSSPYWAVFRAGHLQVIRKSDGSVYRTLDIPSTGIPGFPSRSVLQGSQAWDAVWDSGGDPGDTNYIWIYYKSSTNPRIIQKARYNYASGVLEAGLQFTADPLGASGSEIVAIRVPRQRVDTRCVLVDVAMQDGAGSPTTLLTLRDTTMNRAPDPPVVSPISSFNATASKQIDWTFLDESQSDFATAQDIQIWNVTNPALGNVYTPTHVPVTFVSGRIYRHTIPANTLSNDTVYQIRVRSYDSVDAPSDWSEWVQFSTTATGGSVIITQPATDDEPLNRAAVDISWTYSNTNPAIVQSGYRVRVYNNETGVSVADSTLVTSTATTYTISGLTSDVEYRVEVTIKDSNNQTSGAGVRLIKPDFNNPSLPQIVTVSGVGYIEVRVTNPPPTGDNPVTVRNQIARKESTEPEEAFVVIGECPPNGVYQDWTVASGVEYTYKARGSSE